MIFFDQALISPCFFNKFPEGSTLDFKSDAMAERWMPPPHAPPSPRVRSRAHLRATVRTAVACSTCAWACAHLSLVATSAATWAVCSGRRLEESESSFELAGGGHTLAVLGTGHRQVWSYREPGAGPIQHALCPIPSAALDKPLSLSTMARAYVGRSANLWAR